MIDIFDDADDFAVGVSKWHLIRDDRVRMLGLAILDEPFTCLHDTAIVGTNVIRLGCGGYPTPPASTNCFPPLRHL